MIDDEIEKEKRDNILKMYNEIISECRYCFACAGKFPDGETRQAVFNRLVKEKIINLQMYHNGQ